MYVDRNLEFSDAQAVTGSAISSNVYDLLSVRGGAAAAGDISPNVYVDAGLGSDLVLVVKTQTACTDAGSDATLNVTIESADDAGLTSNVRVHAGTGAMAFAVFSPAGTWLLVFRLPAGQYGRYLGLRYTVGSGPLTAGAFDAFLTPALQLDSRIYKTAVVVQ